MLGKIFGHKEKLERQLAQEGGVVAWATITDMGGEWDTASIDAFHQVSSRTTHAKITVMVQPEAGEPFEASFRQAFTDDRPFKGWQCKVIYDPKDRSRIAVLEDSITPPGIDHAAADDMAQIRREAMAAAASGNVAEFVESMKIRAQSGQLSGMTMPAGQAVSAGATASKPDVADELSKLAELRDRGVLTQAEFEAQKAKLLAES